MKRLIHFGLAADCNSAAAQCLASGLDGDLGPVCYQNLSVAVQAGLVDEAAVDRAAGNVLRAKFVAGLYDGHAYADINASLQMNGGAAQRLAHETALESVVLLQNLNQTLPLKVGARGVTRIAIVGPNAGCANASNTCLYGGGPDLASPVEAMTAPYCELQYECRISPNFLLQMQNEWRIAPEKR